ncbi:hypothetical protein F4680DRAFT_373463 [Xylaria scruposa]|nr:hypothetical protein F4680DRAFT_373463 [Xylaria scruposa]
MCGVTVPPASMREPCVCSPSSYPPRAIALHFRLVAAVILVAALYLVSTSSPGHAGLVEIIDYRAISHEVRIGCSASETQPAVKSGVTPNAPVCMRRWLECALFNPSSRLFRALVVFRHQIWRRSNWPHYRFECDTHRRVPVRDIKYMIICAGISNLLTLASEPSPELVGGRMKQIGDQPLTRWEVLNCTLNVDLPAPQPLGLIPW